MTAIRPQGLEGFLRKPDPAVGILLIYGDEPAAIRDLAARAVKQVAGSLDDPFTVVRLDDGALAADPARLVLFPEMNTFADVPEIKMEFLDSAAFERDLEDS